jgi:hypothetical protein
MKTVETLKKIQRELTHARETERITKETAETKQAEEKAIMFKPVAEAIQELREAGARWLGKDLPECGGSSVTFMDSDDPTITNYGSIIAEANRLPGTRDPFALRKVDATGREGQARRFATADELIAALLKEIAEHITGLPQ